MTDAERTQNTPYVEPTVLNDSVQLYNKKVPSSTYQSEYSAESWFADFKVNKVAFDKNYDEQVLDIHGIVDEINNNLDCAEIVIKGTDNPFELIKFSNCSEGKDHWSDEVVKTSVGQEVHIRGIYSKSLSSRYNMELYKCHIITNK